MRLHHAHTRDSSLRRLSLANRWLLAGSVALTGVLTEVAAQAFPGRAKASSTSSAAGKTRAKAQHGPSRTATHKSITPPAEAPKAAGEASAEAAGEPAHEATPEATHEATPEATHEPAPEATHEATPEASAPQASAPSVESSGSSGSSGSAESSAPPVQESSAPAVSGGS